MKKSTIISTFGLLLLTACNSKQDYAVEPLTVETETVSTTAGATLRNYVGTIEEEEAVSVSFTGMGTLRRVLVSEGQSVTQGQLLAEMDDTQARNMLEATEASCRQAEDAIARYKQLYDKGSLAESKWIEAQSKLDEARASLKAAQKNLQDCRLLAPVNGVVGQRHMTAGATALPSQPVVTIYKINNVKVKVSIPEREIATIATNTPSKIEVAAAGKTVPGGRIEKGFIANNMTHTYDIRITVPNTDHTMLPGMVCNVVLGETGETQDVAQDITLPIRCIQLSAEGTHFVWIVDENQKAQRQPVTLGQTAGNRMVIDKGLTPGIRVITAGYQKVSEGQEVRLANKD